MAARDSDRDREREMEREREDREAASDWLTGLSGMASTAVPSTMPGSSPTSAGASVGVTASVPGSSGMETDLDSHVGLRMGLRALAQTHAQAQDLDDADHVSSQAHAQGEAEPLSDQVETALGYAHPQRERGRSQPQQMDDGEEGDDSAAEGSYESFMDQFVVSPDFTVMCFNHANSGSQPQSGGPGEGPLFAVREWDVKVIRKPLPNHKKKAGLAHLNRSSEQNIRVAIRQAILDMGLRPKRATKEEVRLLKENGVLGKRAPSCSLLSGPDMIKLLLAFGQDQRAEQLKAALQNYRFVNPHGSASASSGAQSYVHSHAASLGTASAVSSSVMSPGLSSPIFFQQLPSLSSPGGRISALSPTHLHQQQPSPSPQTQSYHGVFAVPAVPAAVQARRKRKARPDAAESSNGKDRDPLDALIHAAATSSPLVKAQKVEAPTEVAELKPLAEMENMLASPVASPTASSPTAYFFDTTSAMYPVGLSNAGAHAGMLPRSGLMEDSPSAVP